MMQWVRLSMSSPCGLQSVVSKGFFILCLEGVAQDKIHAEFLKSLDVVGVQGAPRYWRRVLAF